MCDLHFKVSISRVTAGPRRDSGRSSRRGRDGPASASRRLGLIPLPGALPGCPGLIPAARDAATPPAPRRGVRTPGPVARPRQRERMRLRQQPEMQPRSKGGRQLSFGGTGSGGRRGAPCTSPPGCCRGSPPGRSGRDQSGRSPLLPPRALPPPETRGPPGSTCRRRAPSSRRGPARHRAASGRPRPGAPRPPRPSYLCCSPTSPNVITWGTSSSVGHAPEAMQPNTPHSSRMPSSSSSMARAARGGAAAPLPVPAPLQRLPRSAAAGALRQQRRSARRSPWPSGLLPLSFTYGGRHCAPGPLHRLTRPRLP